MILYQVDVSGHTPELGLDRFFATFATGEDLDPVPEFLRSKADVLKAPSEEVKQFATALVEGVCRERERLDDHIRKISTHWRIERMAKVDLNLLRMGVYEILFLSKDVPRKVVINEAVEIAKRFGTQESSAFINGILDRVKPDEAL